MAFVMLSKSAMSEVDTLKYHTDAEGFVYYDSPDIIMQAARFELGTPAYLRQIILTLDGKSPSGHARIRIFGYEGGLAAPFVEKDLTPPLTAEKTGIGLQKIIVTLQSPLLIDNYQFFVGIDNLSPGVLLLSDHASKAPTCETVDDSYRYQLLKMNDSSWLWGRYSFAIEAVTEPVENAVKQNFADVSSAMRFPESGLSNASIAWADIDSDGFLDLLAGGHLYKNNGGTSFTDVTATAGLSGSPRANAFIDVNNDAKPDILFIGDTLGSTELYIASDAGHYIHHHLNLPKVLNPTCFSIADADGNGYLDIFIGQGKGAGASQLWLNDGKSGFNDHSATLVAQHSAGVYPVGSSWVDIDNDGHLELFVANSMGANDIYKVTGDSTILRTIRFQGNTATEAGRAVGTDWKDYDNDGSPDLLLPYEVYPSIVKTMNQVPGTVFLNRGDEDHPLADYATTAADNAFSYDAKRSGGCGGDINNDGSMDLVTATSSACSFVQLFVQQNDRAFKLRSLEYGLGHVSIGKDVILVDYDNDGRLDISTLQDGKLKLFKNQGEYGSNKFVELDLQNQSGSQAVGARATVYTGKFHYMRDVSIGRGLNMEDPGRLHFGVGDASIIDSIKVLWPGRSTVETFTGISVNRVNRIVEGGSNSAGAGTKVTAYALPNPFSRTLNIAFTLLRRQHVRLEIFNSAGERLRVLIDEERDAGQYSTVWDAMDSSGEKAAQGTYIYRVTTEDGEASGQAALVR
jgi:hypothetical protein